MNKLRNTSGGTASSERPLNARSLALSALLGTHPPLLPAGALVALGRLFGITDGAMRTALSRMAADGEVVAEHGRYRVIGPLLDRQRAQDEGRRPPARPWQGDWHTVVALDGHRTLAQRRSFRATMIGHRFGELRPDIWMRPADLAPPQPQPELVVTTGNVSADARLLAGRLWDLDAIATTAAGLERRITHLVAALDAAAATDPTPIAPLFTAAASVVRFLRTEPLLPAAVVPDGWPPAALRSVYDDAEQRLQARLRRFFSEVDTGTDQTARAPAPMPRPAQPVTAVDAE